MTQLFQCGNRRLYVQIILNNLTAILIVSLVNIYSPYDTNNFVIPALAHTDHYRCSHVPPTLEQINHVWLDGSNFTNHKDNDSPTNGMQPQQANDSGFTVVDATRASPNDALSETFRPKSKRHIDSSMKRRKDSPIVFDNSPLVNDSDSQSGGDDIGDEIGSIQNTLMNLLKKLERPILPRTSTKSGEDLVPMQIKVHYDSSVSLLDKQKLDLINGTVIPAVVKFFEDVLSIKRKYTIDKFRIARRCPNSTIYYARDVVGSSRPYCMDRCEDHAVCGEIIVPQEHLAACSFCNRTSRRCSTNYASEGSGVANAQLLLYVSARQTVRCKKDQTIAYAAHCAQDTKTDRPVAGHANLCPMSISTDPRDLKALIATVKHELTHVLGFSVSLFGYYRDEQGKPLPGREYAPGPIPVDPSTGYAKWSDRMIKRVVRRGWLTGKGPIDKEVYLMTTPTVVREVRRHFNCSSLEGAELEDQGSDGTSMTHWEKRLFENEAMTGTHTQNSVYSRITLAVLQDTGWYVANFSRAERLDWGRDLGCDFATKSCKSWIDERRSLGRSIRPFCDRVKGDVLQIACTEDRNSKAVCNMRHYKEPLPSVYRNFDHLDGIDHINGSHDHSSAAHYGGSVDLADYCPFIQEFSWQAHNVTTRGSRCDLGINSLESEKNPALEHYGPDSRCFEHGHRWEQKTCHYKRHWHHYGAGCYKFTCTNDHINVIIGNHSYPCYYADQVIHVEQVVSHWLYNGSVLCPSCEKICPAAKCQLYDKRIIDAILSRAYSNELDIGATPEDVLKSIFDEVYNMIDNNKVDAAIDYKSLPKYLSILKEATELVSHKELTDQLTLFERIREKAPYILTFPFSKTAHNNIQPTCSGAMSSNINKFDLYHLILLLTSTGAVVWANYWQPTTQIKSVVC